MQINASELLKATGNEETLDLEEPLTFPEDGLDILSPVRLKIHLINTGETILATGALKTSIKLNCVRCLKEFNCPLKIKFEEQYSKNPHPHIYNNVSKDEELIFPIDEDGTLDLTESIRQNILINFPMKPLCSSVCPPVKSQAEEKHGDPRLGKLKDLL
jgi:uncharacterized protein